MCGEWEWSWARFDPGFSLAGLLQSNEGQTQFGFRMSLVRLTMEENAVRHPLLLTRTQARGKKTHTCNKIKMIKRRGRDIMWRGRKKKDREVGEEWMMNERIVLLRMRALLPAGRRCSSRKPSVSHSAIDMWCMSACQRVRASDEARVFHQEAHWVAKYWGEKLTRNCFSFTRGRESHRVVHERKWCAWERGDRKKKNGGREASV